MPAWNTDGPIGWQASHSTVACPSATSQRHAAHYKPSRANAGCAQVCQKLFVGFQGAWIPALELWFFQLVEIPPHLLGIERQHDHATLKQLVGLVMFDSHVRSGMHQKVSVGSL
jgi:hypothetical protein